jgi:hypothetical protein
VRPAYRSRGPQPLISRKKVILKKDYIHHVVDIYHVLSRARWREDGDDEIRRALRRQGPRRHRRGARASAKPVRSASHMKAAASRWSTGHRWSTGGRTPRHALGRGFAHAIGMRLTPERVWRMIRGTASTSEILVAFSVTKTAGGLSKA